MTFRLMPQVVSSKHIFLSFKQLNHQLIKGPNKQKTNLLFLRLSLSKILVFHILFFHIYFLYIIYILYILHIYYIYITYNLQLKKENFPINGLCLTESLLYYTAIT